MIKFLQINLNHCRAAQDLMLQTIRSRNIGICIIAEPHAIPNNPCWAASQDGKAAILWNENGVPHAGILHRRDEHSVTVRWPSFSVTACYISPNAESEEFDTLIDELDDITNSRDTEYIIGGDFNSKAHIWGSNTTNDRGEILLRWSASKNINLLNTGSSPTCVRPQGTSIVDLTWAEAILSSKIREWRVLDEYTASDHMYIYFVMDSTYRHVNTDHKVKYNRWAYKKMDVELYKETLEWLCADETALSTDNAATWMTNTITEACNISTPKVKPFHKKNMYWWNVEIANRRKECSRARKKWQRAKKRRGVEDIVILEEEYRLKKAELNTMIRKAKAQAWEELIADLDRDPWGLSYRLVLNKLRRSQAALTEMLDPEVVHSTIGKLFPHDVRHADGEEAFIDSWDENDCVSEVEVYNILKKAKANKAPGPDGIKSIFLKRVPEITIKRLTTIYNTYLKAGVFPEVWKRAILVLIPKGKLDAMAPKTRPICLLNELGKVFEKVIVERINMWMEENPASSLFSKQYGFRKNTSTCDALFHVQEFIKKNTVDQQVVIGVSLDINNAFNSLKWSEIRKALREKEFPAYIRRIIGNYLSNRTVEFSINNGKTMRKAMTAGVPQGSVLGPVLWNLTYDWALRTPLERNCEVIGYADDTLLMIRANTAKDAIIAAKLQMSKVLRRIAKLGLTVNTSKTNIVIFYGKKQKNKKEIESIKYVQIGEAAIPIVKAMKYLGIFIDNKWKFNVHVEYLEGKVQNMIKALSRIMPNLRGPCAKKRQLYAHVIASIINYGAPIWSDALLDRKLSAKINRLQRSIAIRIIAGYKTISADAALVLARIPPAFLHTMYHKRVFLRIKDLKNLNLWSRKEEKDIKADEKVILYRQWSLYIQRTEAAGKRTCNAIAPRFQLWMDRLHGCISFRISQLLTGHGLFYAYLYRIGKVETPICPLCGVEEDTTEHMLITCPRWEIERGRLQEEIGLELHLSRIIEQILESEDKWKAFHTFAESTMTQKEEDERCRERNRRLSQDP